MENGIYEVTTRTSSTFRILYRDGFFLSTRYVAGFHFNNKLKGLVSKLEEEGLIPEEFKFPSDTQREYIGYFTGSPRLVFENIKFIGAVENTDKKVRYGKFH